MLCSTGIDDFKKLVSGGIPEPLLRAEIEGKQRLYRALTGSVSRGEIRLIEDAGHVTMPMRRPDAVIQAIRDLLGRAGPRVPRVHGTLP